MVSQLKVIASITVSFLVLGVVLAVVDAAYVEYKRIDNVKDVEILKFLPSGADKVDYISEDYLDAAYIMLDFQERAYKRRGGDNEKLLYEFMKWTTKDLKAFGISFYGNNDLYVLKHKKEVEEFQFTDTETFEELENYNGIKIYKFNYVAGNKRGTIYFASKGKYVVHSSSTDLLKRSLDLIDGKGGETAYDEFEYLIEQIPRNFWGAIVLEHVKKPDAKIPYLASGKLYNFNALEFFGLKGIIVSDPRRLNSGRGDISPVYYVVLQCTDEKCAEEYADFMYEYKGFDIKVEDNFVHAKRFALEPGKYDYMNSGMFPYTEAYLGLFFFFGYEWRGNDVGEQYSIQSPEYPMPTIANKGIQSPFF